MGSRSARSAVATVTLLVAVNPPAIDLRTAHRSHSRHQRPNLGSSDRGPLGRGRPRHRIHWTVHAGALVVGGTSLEFCACRVSADRAALLTNAPSLPGSHRLTNGASGRMESARRGGVGMGATNAVLGRKRRHASADTTTAGRTNRAPNPTGMPRSTITTSPATAFTPGWR
jgi:hypothetical protein